MPAVGLGQARGFLNEPLENSSGSRGEMLIMTPIATVTMVFVSVMIGEDDDGESLLGLPDHHHEREAHDTEGHLWCKVPSAESLREPWQVFGTGAFKALSSTAGCSVDGDGGR
jgi:hypothetical protein